MVEVSRHTHQLTYYLLLLSEHRLIKKQKLKE